jgi:thiamine-phosphate pyrophosphorylase
VTPDLAQRLALLVITDPELAAGRSLLGVVEEALEGGCRAVQLRLKGASARQLLTTAMAFRQLTHRYGALLFVNDRVDVALAAGADGVHLGPTDLPVAAVRAWAGPRMLIGYSTDDPEVARATVEAGADYLGCGAVFGTTTKDVGNEAIGVQRLDEVARAVRVPVVGIGGITPDNAHHVAQTAAAGVAVVGAVMSAPDPRRASELLLAPFQRA